MSLKILTVVGARPQFVKAAAFSRELQENFSSQIEEIICHTGQHFDSNMSKIFFSELGIPRPAYTLETRTGTQGKTTGQIMGDLDEVIQDTKPDFVLIYGDTNSTLAAALSASKLNAPLAHVEAGMRSWNRRMPEEVNRVVADHLAELNLAPSEVAMQNLATEGLGDTAHLVGDIMQDALEMFSDSEISANPVQLGLEGFAAPNGFVLATFHRQENTESPERLTAILQGLNKISRDRPVLLPMHPRLRITIRDRGLESLLGPKVHVVEPLSYIQMIRLVKQSDLVITDSGGLQKEAFFLRTPCVTVRDETEWVETVQLGWNTLCRADSEEMSSRASLMINSQGKEGQPYGTIGTGRRIAEILLNH
jgi:UDP-GlcNAc3NAcA epimerase